MTTNEALTLGAILGSLLLYLLDEISDRWLP